MAVATYQTAMAEETAAAASISAPTRLRFGPRLGGTNKFCKN